ncbi:MAG TPA: hypothetical protein VNJ01_12960 [Bacteriovoracaceae bacterium]|nr:hypothetical protein [Bacteriovoracaceae bacterium]
MKKLLIIQQDDPYFLFETIAVLEKYQSAFKAFETTLLVSEVSYRRITTDQLPLFSGITTEPATLTGQHFDLSVNLSLLEASWDLHGSVDSNIKLGAQRINGQLLVPDLWSSYLLTLKAKAPFLTFHLQDIYRNILGIKGLPLMETRHTSIKQIAFGFCSTELFPSGEQELLITELAAQFPNTPIQEISEIDLVSDLSHTMYIGPATFEALRLCQAGGKGIYLSSHFQGLNLLPCSEGHLYLSSKGRQLKASEILPLVRHELSHSKEPLSSPHSLYRVEKDQLFGAYLKSLNGSDDNFPFYQAHVVLWSFLLDLHEINVEVTRCNEHQLQLLRANHQVLSKVLRLQDYAMASIDAIYQESRSTTANREKIDGHISNLLEIDRLTDQIASSFSLLRPVLDFYRIRRGQNDGLTLLEQSQKSFLTYSEEQQALRALEELFSVTLSKNEVNI